MDEKIKQSIDNMSYESMLSLWRNAPVGHPYFKGEIGDYYRDAMNRKRKEVGNDAHVKASKNIGWEG